MRKLHLLVGRQETIRAIRFDLKLPLMVPLEQRLALIPLAGSVLADIEGRQAADVPALRPIWFPAYSPALESWLREQSRHGLLGHFYIDTIRDAVLQVGLLWKDGKMVLASVLNDPTLVEEIDPINTVLRLMGAYPKWWMNEMQTVGLGRHAAMDGWLAEAEEFYRNEQAREISALKEPE